jgi:ferredoxin
MFHTPKRRSPLRPAQLVLNPLLCNGHGICMLMAKDVIGLDQWGFPILLLEELSGHTLAAAQHAVRACPAGALSLVHIVPPPVEPVIFTSNTEQPRPAPGWG